MSNISCVSSPTASSSSPAAFSSGPLCGACEVWNARGIAPNESVVCFCPTVATLSLEDLKIDFFGFLSEEASAASALLKKLSVL
jgi:hypothetical protein